MAEVASAFVSLLPSAKGWGSKVDSEIGPELSKAGKRGGGRLSSALGGVLKKSAIGIGATAGAALGTALFTGFKRLNAIDQAKAKLSGLGHTTQGVSKIMDNALTSVRGTAFGLDEAAATAAGAVASGVKPGQDLTHTLKLVADAATIGGASMGEMGAIFNKVAASGKVQGDVIAQLGDRGIPILQMLAKQLRVTPAEVSELARKGAIGFDDFRKAMDKGLGGAALESGKTFSGALKNMKASLARIGANMLSGLFPVVQKGITSLTGLMGKLEPVVAKLGEQVGGMLAKAFERIGPLFDQIGPLVGQFADRASTLLPRLIEIGRVVGKNLLSALEDLTATFGPLLKDLASVALKVAPGLFKLLAGALAAAASVLASVTGFMRDHSVAMRALVVGVLASLAAWKAWTTAVKVWQVATKVAIAVQALWNAVLAANPIGLAVIAIVALAAGMVYAYKKSETFRNVVDKVWGVLKVVGSFIAKVFVGYLRTMAAMWLTVGIFGVKALRTLYTAAFAVFGGILKAAEKGLGWIPGIGGKIKSAREAFDNFGDRTVAKLDAVEGKLRGVRDAINGIPASKTFTLNVQTLKSAAAKNEKMLGGLARGTDYWRGGLTWVGERGPEILDLPRGSRVIPNHKVDAAALPNQATSTGGGTLRVVLDAGSIGTLTGWVQDEVGSGNAYARTTGRRR